MTPTTRQPPVPDFHLIDETEDFLVVHKSPGVSFHSDGDQPGLFDTVKQNTGLDTLYPVHRLDRITSGLILMAKTHAAAQTFGDLFQNHEIEKYYLALGKGKPAKKQGTIKGDMIKARRGAWKLTRSLQQPAITYFRSFGTAAGIRLFLIKPASGKTHQIRVALKSLGTPIIGDRLYGESSDSDRVYLHAFGLRFTFNGKNVEYTKQPESGELFQMPEIAKIITETLSPPWKVSFPGE